MVGCEQLPGCGSRTGEGSRIRVPLSDVALATAGNLGFLGEAELNGVDRPQTGVGRVLPIRWSRR